MVQDCDQCGRKHRIFHQGKCLRCHEKKLTEARLKKVERSFSPASKYNQYLLDLFLVYTRKLKLRSGYASQAEKLQILFERETISFIGTWNDIYSLSDKHKIWDKNYSQTGCAFKKIGRMLQGLGVIDSPERCGRRLRHLEKVRSSFALVRNKSWADSFINMLKKSDRALRTQILYLHHLKHLEGWLAKNDYSVDFSRVTQKLAGDYFDSLRADFRSPSQIYSIYCNFNKFYRWGAHAGHASENPFESLRISYPGLVKRHLSEADVDKLFHFVKNKKSDPELALIILLVLVFGLTKEDLSRAQLSFLSGGRLRILVCGKPRSAGRTRTVGDRILEMPAEPRWVLDLQRSFMAYWKKQIESVHQIYERTPLILPHNHQYAVSLDSTVIDNRIKAATTAALGRRVPFTLLRNTCGVINTRHNDASVLSTLGWSTKHSFAFVRLPREIVGPSQAET